MANPMQQPQSTDDQALPVQPIVSGSANQTNARTGMVAPDRYQPFVFNASGSAPVPADQQAPTIAPTSNGFGTMSARPIATAVPQAPNPVDHAKAGLAALLGLTKAHAAQGEALVASGQPPTPPPQVPQAPAGPQQRQMAGNLLATQGGELTVPELRQPGSQPIGSFNYTPQTREAAAALHGIDPNHPGLAPHKMTRDEYIQAMSSVPLSAFQKMQELRKIPTMQEQAVSEGAQLQDSTAAFKDYILKQAQGAQYPIDQSLGPQGGMPPPQ